MAALRSVWLWTAVALLALALLAALTPQARPASGAAAGDRPVVLASFTVLADIARNVGGDLVEVRSLTKPGTQIHGYEPTAQDVAAVAAADLIVLNGLGLDAWLDRLLVGSDARRVVVTGAVRPEYIRGGEYDGVVNPHAWLAPGNGALYAAAIAEALGRLDPAHAGVYRVNAERYGEQLRAVAREFRRSLAQVPPQRRVLVSCEGAFSYLTRDAGLDEVYLWPVNSEQQATGRQVAAVVERVRADGTDAVFCESTVSDLPQRQVAAETGARFAGTLHVDSLTPPDGPVPTYLDLLRTDLDLIVTGLRGSGG